MKRSRFIFSMSKVSEAAEADTTVDTSVGDAAVDTPTVEAKTPAAGSAKARKRPNKRKAEDSPAKAPPAKAAKNDEATPKRKSGRPVAEKKPKVKESPVFVWLIEVLVAADRPGTRLRGSPMTIATNDAEPVVFAGVASICISLHALSSSQR